MKVREIRTLHQILCEWGHDEDTADEIIDDYMAQLAVLSKLTYTQEAVVDNGEETEDEGGRDEEKGQAVGE